MEDNKYNKNTTNEETNSLNVDSIEVEKKSDNIKKNETNIEKEKNERFFYKKFVKTVLP